MKLLSTPQTNQESCSSAAYTLAEALLRPEVADEWFPYVKTGLALKKVAIRGEVQGLLFTFTVRQEFINDGEGCAKDVSCSFLGGSNAVMLGLEAVIGERKFTGMVVKTSAATRKKECRDAREAAIALQWHSAKLGNIERGETVVVEMHWARLLAFGPGEVRLGISAVPDVCHATVPETEGLASPEIGSGARCAFSVDLTIRGDMAQGSISCPGHPAAIRKIGEEVRVSLEAQTAPESDLSLLISDIPATSHALYMQEKGRHMALASFAPEIPLEGASPLGIKILVDCSHPMSPLSLWRVQQGLEKLLTLLTRADKITYSRAWSRDFKDEVKHLTRERVYCTPEMLKKVADAIAATEVNDEIKYLRANEFRALCQDMSEFTFFDEGLPKAVLLVTGNDRILDGEEIIEIARTTGHRIFAVGTGYAGSNLRDIALHTGGACEIVSEGEDMAEAILRIFQKMRGSIAMRPRIEWGQKPLWQSRLLGYFYAGETVHAFALLEGEGSPAPVLSWEQVGTTWERRGTKHHEACRHCESTDNEALLRIGRLCQMEESASDAEKLALALKYQLVSDETTLLLVHERQKPATRLEALSGVECIRWISKPESDVLISGFMSEHSPPPPDAWRKAFSTKKELLEFVLSYWQKYGNSVKSLDKFMEILHRSEKGGALGTFFDLLWDNSDMKYNERHPVFLEWAFNKIHPEKMPDKYSTRLQRSITSILKAVDVTAAGWLREILDEWYANA